MKSNKKDGKSSYEFAFMMGSEDKKVLKGIEDTIVSFNGTVEKKKSGVKNSLHTASRISQKLFIISGIFILMDLN